MGCKDKHCTFQSNLKVNIQKSTFLYTLKNFTIIIYSNIQGYIFYCPLEDISAMKRSKTERTVAEELESEQLKELLELIGKRIRHMRKEKKFRMDHFAYEIGMTRNTLLRSEQGGDMLLSNFLKIVYGLDTEMPEFFQEILLHKPLPPRPKT